MLGTEAKPEYGLDKPALTLSVTRKGGEKLEYRLGPTGKEGYAVLKSSARPEYFRVPGYTADALIKAAGTGAAGAGGARYRGGGTCRCRAAGRQHSLRQPGGS